MDHDVGPTISSLAIIWWGMDAHKYFYIYIHPNHPRTWDPLNYTRSIKFSPNQMDWTVGSKFFFFFFNIKSLNLWVTDEGVRGMGLTPNSIYGPIQDVYFHHPHGWKSRPIPVRIGRYEPVSIYTVTIFWWETDIGITHQNTANISTDIFKISTKECIISSSSLPRDVASLNEKKC